jgi:hypothetical protein
MIPQSTAPAFGENYGTGWIGFTDRHDNPISDGIAYFERWEIDPDGIHVEHVFIVTGETTCVEALARGVQKSSLSDYFTDPNCRTYFRRPAAWTPAMGQAITDTAISHIGDKYGYGIIVADLLANTFIGHQLNRLTNNAPNRIISKLLDRPREEVCSELVALCMQSVAVLANRGCLDLPARLITPQDLFVDSAVFDPGFWRVSAFTQPIA